MTADALQPFGQAAEFYHQAGWPPFPLPEGQKWPPPTGYTGESGIDAASDQLKAWIAENGHRNIGVRMPPNVIGVDVDNYGNKVGGADLAVLEVKLGELPPTCISTSRFDGVSGIRFFSVPIGLRWPGNLSNSIEIIQRKHRYAVVEPSMHPDTGRRYRWLDADWQPLSLPPSPADLPPMPDAWVEFLTGGETDTGPAPKKATVTPLDTETVLTLGAPCQAMVNALGKYQERKAGKARHDAMRDTVLALVRLGEQGHEGAGEAVEQLRGQFIAEVASDRTGVGGEFQRALTGGVGKALGSPTPEGDRRCCGVKPPQVTVLTDPDQRLKTLGRLLSQLRTWQHLPDPTHVIATLATAATRNADGEPCWLLMVAPPSSGKTETARLLDDVADARLNEVTAAGLLGWSKGKTVKPSGILSRVGERALVTFGDLSSLLATSDRGGRDQVFGLLRRAYDGHVTRDIAPPGRTQGDERLSWSGRLTVVACVTGAIDRYTAHADQLGPRWLQVRIPERTTEQKRQASQLARRSDLSSHRAAAREAVANLLAQLPAELPELADDIADAIEDAALVTTWGRAAVPRNGYGRREIEDVPVIEEPMRLVQQLGGVARGVLALGLPATAAAAVTRRIALDSMPAARHAVLKALSTGEVFSTAGCARAAGLDRKVARMALEELAAIGVVENNRSDEEDDPVGVVNWRLSGDDGEVITKVFEAHRASGGGWDETWCYTSTSPQKREEDSTGVNLRFVPPLLSHPTATAPAGLGISGRR